MSQFQTPTRPARSLRTPSATPNTLKTDSPGNWRHPRMAEITRRRAASVFSESNLKTLIYNGLAMLFCYLVGHSPGTPFKQMRQIATVIPADYMGILGLVVNAALAVNMVRAILPLFRATDAMADIPLTPSQRKLLGLGAVHVATTPNTVYTTPPRYTRTRTPSVSGSAATATATASRGSVGTGATGGTGADFSKTQSYGGSPISSPLLNKGPGRAASSGSPFSPKGALSRGRTSSFGSPGSMPGPGASMFGESALAALPGTPSPTGKRLSMGLNNKWLYEKGRRSSSGTKAF